MNSTAEEADDETWNTRFNKAGESRRFREVTEKARRDAQTDAAAPLQFDQP
ncbi:MAG: hypothetical protein K8S99_03790 [Planctomycetes bacterium]|nr:hypothetical protein [Planctomycetota bacterium]